MAQSFIAAGFLLNKTESNSHRIEMVIYTVTFILFSLHTNLISLKFIKTCNTYMIDSIGIMIDYARNI